MTQSEALTILKTGVNVFLTGEPGAGKTHTINEYVKYLKSYGIEPAITASTGIAATHIGGMTIHSWSGIGIKSFLSKYDLDKIAETEYIHKRIKRAEVLIIDEVSMLPPETLSMVDAVCKTIKQSPKSFGGLQVILVGDFFQLPPVTKVETNEYNQEVFAPQVKNRFAYQSPAWENLELITCYLSEQHRQDDTEYLSILTAIRSNSFNETHLVRVESRKIIEVEAPENSPKLYSHNKDVDRINNEKLSKINKPEVVFKMESHGAEGLIEGLKKSCLSPENLTLKIGAEVMFTKNNVKEGFYNGTLGTVVSFQKYGDEYPIVELRDGRRITVEPMDWTIEENGKIRAQIMQIPLRLAWAITVHKSQGMSMDSAVIDLSAVFEYGQGYVALSRVRRLSGIHLLGWNNKSFSVDPEVSEKDNEFREDSERFTLAFAQMTEEEIAKAQQIFLTKCGVKIDKESNPQLRSGQARVHSRLNKPSTYDETLKLWNEGHNAIEIAKLRKLKETTILDHVQSLAEAGKIEHSDLDRLITPRLEKILSEIHSVFDELGIERLAPVFEKLEGRYPYDDLRLARILYRGK